MKKITYIVVCMFLLYGTGLVSCKKNLSEIIPATGYNPAGNKAPIAEAGNAQVVTLPVDSVVLDGTESRDTDGEISKYEWYKIEGPASFLIQQPAASVTTVNNLVKGDYWFELKVTDDKGLASIDRVKIEVRDSVIQQGPGECDITGIPRFNATLTPVGNLSLPQTPYIAACGSKLFFAGGAHNYGGVDIYDIRQQSWERAQLSQPRTNLAMVSCGNKVFFAGGNNHDIWYDIVDIYDVTTGNWTVRHLSEPKCVMAGGAVGDKVFFAGGVTEEGWNQTADIEIYDIVNDQWSKTILSEPKVGVTAVTAGDKIYFAGGLNYLNGMMPLRSVDIYDASNNTWSSTTFTVLSGGVSGVVVNDRIYWGGKTKLTGMVEIWDTRNGIVTTTCLSYPRDYPAASARNEYVMFFPTAIPGGVASNDGAPNHFDIYNTVTGAKAIGLINESITGAAIICVNNTIYMAGGYTPSGYTDKVYVLNW